MTIRDDEFVTMHKYVHDNGHTYYGEYTCSVASYNDEVMCPTDWVYPCNLCNVDTHITGYDFPTCHSCAGDLE